MIPIDPISSRPASTWVVFAKLALAPFAGQSNAARRQTGAQRAGRKDALLTIGFTIVMLASFVVLAAMSRSIG